MKSTQILIVFSILLFSPGWIFSQPSNFKPNRANITSAGKPSFNPPDEKDKATAFRILTKATEHIEFESLHNDVGRFNSVMAEVRRALNSTSIDSLRLTYFNEELADANESNDTLTAIYLKNEIAGYFEDRTDEEKINGLKKLMSYDEELGLEKQLALDYSRLASVYLKTKNFDELRNNSNRALKYAEANGVKPVIFNSYYQLGLADLNEKRIDSALRYFKQAEENISPGKDYRTVSIFYADLGKANNSAGNYKAAYETIVKSNQLAGIADRQEAKKSSAISSVMRQFIAKSKGKHAIAKNKNLAILSRQSIAIFGLIGVSIIIIIALIFSSKISKERKRNLAELNEKKQFIEKQRSELDDLNKMKDKVFSVIAHDLRGPVGNLIRLSKLVQLNFKNGTDENKEIGSLINESSKNIHFLLNSLLLWGKTQMNLAYAVRTKYMISENVYDIVKFYQENISAKNIELDFNIDKSHSAYVDEAMIDSVIRNLFENAIKFCNGDGKINVESYQLDEFVKISVTDNGAGIDKNIIERIFSSNGKAAEKKSGLGLILAKEFVKLNGGEMAIQSEKGKGTAISFTLPVYNESIETSENIQLMDAINLA